MAYAYAKRAHCSEHKCRFNTWRQNNDVRAGKCPRRNCIDGIKEWTNL